MTTFTALTTVDGKEAAYALSEAMERMDPEPLGVGVFELFLLTLFGPFFYELNSEILYRLYITDTGYGMRILILGSFLGLIITCILGKRETTLNHPNYKS